MILKDLILNAVVAIVEVVFAIVRKEAERKRAPSVRRSASPRSATPRRKTSKGK